MKIRINKTKKARSAAKGFSLAEVLVAIAVLSVGLVGIYQASTKSLRVAMDSRDEVIAANLAQEGIELLRSTRDTLMLENRADSSVNDRVFYWIGAIGSNDGNIDPVDVQDCWNVGSSTFKVPRIRTLPGDLRLYLDGDQYVTSHTKNNYAPSSESTKFCRRIRVNEIKPSEIYEITSDVDWTGNCSFANCPGNKCIRAITVVTDWVIN